MAVKIGSRVQIHSIQSRPELNGRYGRVVSHDDASSERVGVLLESEAKPLSLKSINLSLTVGSDPVNAPGYGMEAELGSPGSRLGEAAGDMRSGLEDDVDMLDLAPEDIGCVESGWQGLPGRELFLAVRDGDCEMLETLLAESGADIDGCDNDHYFLLHHCVSSAPVANASSLISILATHRADLNARTSDDETPLILAAAQGGHEAATALLAHGTI